MNCGLIVAIYEIFEFGEDNANSNLEKIMANSFANQTDENLLIANLIDVIPWRCIKTIHVHLERSSMMVKK